MEILRTVKPDNEIDYIEDIQILSNKPKQPLIIEQLDFLTIEVDQKLRSKMRNKNYKVEERDSVEILSKPKEPLQTEYIDELLIQGNAKPENQIQLIDQMEILKAAKPKNEIDYIDDIQILKEEKPDNAIESADEFELLSSVPKIKKSPLIVDYQDYLSIEVDQKLRAKNRSKIYSIKEGDSLEILSTPKEPLQFEYIDEINIKGNTKPENKEQLIEQMEILSEEKQKPVNEIEYNDDVIILSKPKAPLKVESVDYLSIEADQNFTRIKKLEKYDIEERDSIELLQKQKEELQTEYIDELYIKSVSKPQNEIQIIDQMEIPKAQRKDQLEVEYIDDILILKEEKPSNEIEKIDRISLLAEQKIEIKEIIKPKVYSLEERDSIILSSEQKPILQTEYIDEIKVTGIKPENEIQLIDQMEIFKTPKRQINEIVYLEDVQIKSGPKAPLIIDQQDYLSIQTDQNLLIGRKPESLRIYEIEERDSIKISSIQQGPLKQEYIDELFIQGYKKPENEIQLIDQMEILPIERRNLIIQNIDDLVIPRDYEYLKNSMKPIWDSLDVQASGGLNLVSHKDLGLERQEIDNFEIIGSINAPILEQEYINSIEIVERNSSVNRQRASLIIDCMDDLQISPSRNEVRFLNANVPRQSYDMENIDDFEIIGRDREEYEVENIDNISYQDKVIENQYDDLEDRAQLEYNREYRDNRMKKTKQINQEYSSEENEYRLHKEENYKNKQKSRYDLIEQESNKTRKQKKLIDQENMYEREDWNKYNELQQINSIYIPKQRESQSYQEGGENYSATGFGMGIMPKNNSNWNEKNRTQGIVNLSVIDDNKKEPWDFDDMAENKENDDEDPKDNENIDKNKEIRKFHNNDYDSDELNDIDPLSGLQKKGKQNEYDKYEKTQKQIKYSGKKEDEKEKKGQPQIPSSTDKYMINYENKIDDPNLKDKKGKGQFQQSSTSHMISHESRRGEEITEKKGTGKFQPSQDEEEIIENKGPVKFQQTYKIRKSGDEEEIKEKGPAQYQQREISYNIIHSGDDEENEKEKKGPTVYRPSKPTYKISHQSGEEEEIEEEKERKGIGKYQTGSANYVYSQQSRKDDEDLKEKKAPGQLISTSENYMISQHSKKDDKDTKEKKGQIPYKSSSLNYMVSQGKRKEDPKITVKQPKTQYKYQTRSKEITGMMKKKPKVKSYEYLRDDNHS